MIWSFLLHGLHPDVECMTVWQVVKSINKIAKIRMQDVAQLRQIISPKLGRREDLFQH